MQRYFLFLLSFIHLAPLFAQNVQTLKGRIVDQQSKSPLIGVTVTVANLQPARGAVTDIDGNYLIREVPLGRQTVVCTYLGYEPVSAPNILLTAGKETVLDLEMVESISSLKEVVVQAVTDKSNADKNFATVSTLPFNAEMTRRFAGSRNDPSRMAANFAGVASNNDARNDIIIRGNSPAGLLWRMEGIDILNPNHFGSMGSTGGPVSILNNNLLDQCSFLTGAFPAMYGNALSGVFDLQMRRGNADRREYTGQIGFSGFELGAEGPVRKSSGSSYLVNYRYSAPALLKNLGFNFGTGSAIPYYQDAAFRVDLPSKKSGRFVVFGMGGLSHIDLLGDLKDTTNFYNNPYQNIHQKTGMGVIGLSHTYFWNKTTYTKLTLAASGIQTKVSLDSLDQDRSRFKAFRDDSWQTRYTAHLMLNKKLSARNTLSAGLIANLLGAYLQDSAQVQPGILRETRFFDGNTGFIQGYVHWQHRAGERLTLNTGLYAQSLTLNQSWSVEPRVNLRYFLTQNQSVTFGLGRHSQIQPLGIYFNQAEEQRDYSNRDLGFTFSNQAVLGYELRIASNWRWNLEGYYQLLDQAPVDSKPSSFSMLNMGADFGLTDRTGLVNEGKGKNYGVEMTLERTFDQGYYVLATASLFRSLYEGSDGVERSSAFDTKYVANLLAGKEFALGHKKVLAFDTRISAAGGKRDTPLDLTQSALQHHAVYLENEAYSLKLDDYFRADFKITFRVNGRKTMQEWFVDLQNLTGHKNLYSLQYDPESNQVRKIYQLGFFPNFNYRIQF